MPANPNVPATLPYVCCALCQPVAIVTATTYTATGADGIISTNNAANTAVSLPVAALVPAGFRLTIINVGAAGATTAVPSEVGADDTINGADAAFGTGLNAQWGSVVFISDGVSNWIAVAGA